ncbi:hypothetical protein JZO77_22730 [Enterococcus hulanensis]|uniref:hypothetical protein n=1 Tax=Enterococcus hulanensis TaxID=2559929 RepID=UPI001A8D4870|nr:hypothetical protein [Enterococcus hulanensis]MBO0459557.1 hypothetical protein [Enterococcus hulanensis]
MKKDTAKLESHLARHPTDAAGVISLIKSRSDNYEYDFLLEQRRKREKARSFERKRERNGS